MVPVASQEGLPPAVWAGQPEIPLKEEEIFVRKQKFSVRFPALCSDVRRLPKGDRMS